MFIFSVIRFIKPPKMFGHPCYLNTLLAYLMRLRIKWVNKTNKYLVRFTNDERRTRKTRMFQ
jgi:hypothetical protein